MTSDTVKKKNYVAILEYRSLKTYTARTENSCRNYKKWSMTLDLRISFSQREAENTATHLLNNAKKIYNHGHIGYQIWYIFFYIERRRGNIRKQNSKVRRKEWKAKKKPRFRSFM